MMTENADTQLAKIAAGIAEPARARMLCALMDGRARTSTELAIIGEISPSTASVHLSKLRDLLLVQVISQGKHRYYQLTNHQVAYALESLMVITNIPKPHFTPSTPNRLRKARTCYNHMAGEVAVAMHDFLFQKEWLIKELESKEVKKVAQELGSKEYQLSELGEQELISLGLDMPQIKKQKRRFACACLDWSERTPHIGGALGAALLQHALKQEWVQADLDSRALSITIKGKRRFLEVFNIII